MGEAKPTPGPWIAVGTGGPREQRLNIRAAHWGCVASVGVDPSLPHWDGPQRANARLIADAGTVFHTTGLTPSQLVEQRDGLAGLLSEIYEMVRQGALPNDGDEWFELTIAALSKARPNTAEGETAQQAPAGATNTKTHALLSMMIGLFLRAKEKIGYQPGSAIDKTVAEAVEHLKDWPYQEATTAQAAESLPAVWLEHSDWSFKALVIDTSPPSEGEKFLEEPDVQDESGLNKYYSRELVLDCIEDALASKAAPRPSAIAESAPAPVLLSDEELCQIEEPYLLNFRIPLGGQYDFARAVEKAVICKMGREPAPQGETNVQLEFASAPRPKTQAAPAAAKEPSP